MRGKLRRIIRCSFGLKCPRCAEGKLFQKRFTMFSHCTICGMKFEREQGYFTGAMYINYGATVFLVFTSYFAFELFTAIPFRCQFWNMGSYFCCIPNLFLSLFKKFVAKHRLRAEPKLLELFIFCESTPNARGRIRVWYSA